MPRVGAATPAVRVGRAALAGLAALVLAACGGGGSDPLPPTDSGTPAAVHRVVTLDHGAFTLRYDCDEHSAVRYSYTLGVDTGNAARTDVFTLGDPKLPAGCGEQTHTATYASVAPGWDRGHLVTANDLFLASHGLRTPERFWMVLITQAAGGERAIAWSIPNTDGLAPLDAYIVSIAALEVQVGADAVGLGGLSNELKAQRAAVSWPLPPGCNPG